ncbi:MAG: L,D-transpeptidase family protein [Akkermansia sp.]|nr:L,D-transpeptidase family protein [Akkermansia sp.]
MKYLISALIALSSLLVSCSHFNKYRFGENSNSYLAGIGTSSGVNTDIPPEARLGQGYWDMPADLKGQKHIIIDLETQKVFYYVGNNLVGYSPMSSGKEGFGTPKGTFKIIQKDANYKSGTYGVLRNRATGEIVNADHNTKSGKKIPAGAYFDPAPMPYWMRITGGYGMHVGFVAGYPVSHGCVRLPEDMAKIFFENTPLGTKVTIR